MSDYARYDPDGFYTELGQAKHHHGLHRARAQQDEICEIKGQVFRTRDIVTVYNDQGYLFVFLRGGHRFRWHAGRDAASIASDIRFS